MSHLVVLTLLSILLTTIYLYIKFIYSHWKRRGVPFAEPKIPFGNLSQLFRRTRSFGQVLDDLHRSSTEPVLGIFLGTLLGWHPPPLPHFCGLKCNARHYGVIF